MTTRPSTTCRAIYEIDGRIVDALDRDAIDTLADAHRRRSRPRCLCRPEGTPMYVARLGDGFIVKRMPETGEDHAPGCASHGAHVESEDGHKHPQADEQERPDYDTNTIDLAFPITAAAGQPTGRPSRDAREQSKAHGISLDTLLRLLWYRAGLNEWHPAFAGKRNWAVVRWRLLKAAEALKLRSGAGLTDLLYIPEVFSVQRREAIEGRLAARWVEFTGQQQTPRHMLLIAEVKEIVPTRQGFELLLKQLPGLWFAHEEAPSGRDHCRGDRSPTRRAASSEDRLVMIGTVTAGAAGQAAILELSLMNVTREWLPT